MVANGESPVTEIRPGIYQCLSEKPGSHVYLIKGTDKNMLIDTGVAPNFLQLRKQLRYLELRPRDIHLIILSHEHFDHIGATTFFCDSAVIGAHRLAANKIELQDEFVTLNRYQNTRGKLFRSHLWLEDGALIDLGNYKFQIIHTPGHTSGCICLYEPDQRLLFSGDTVFAKGTLSEIATSGNISDYVSSLRRLSSLHIAELYPGHGGISLTAEEDMKKALEYARSVMDDSKILFEALSAKDHRTRTMERLLKAPWSGISRQPGSSQRRP